MSSIISIIILVICFAGMAIGLLRKKDLKRGCSLGDDCACKNEPLKDPSKDCEHKA